MLTHLIKFLGVGATATLLQYAILVLLVELASIDAVIASTAGFGISSIFNYLLNYYFTFNCSKQHSSTVIRFILVVVIGLALNATLMYFLHSNLGLQYLLAQILSTALVLCWNFLAHRIWTYKATTLKSPT